MKTPIDLAKALATFINSPEVQAELPESVAAKYVLRPSYSLEELSELRCSVIPAEGEITAASRSQNQTDWTIEIGLQQRIENESDPRAEEMVALAWAIADRFRAELVLEHTYHWKATAFPTLFHPERMDEHSVATTVLAVTFRMRS